MERNERDSSLSLDPAVGLGTSKLAGLDLIPCGAGDFDLLLLRVHGAHEGDNPRDEGAGEDMMRSDISCAGGCGFPTGREMWSDS